MLSGFELYPRWVPKILIINKSFIIHLNYALDSWF